MTEAKRGDDFRPDEAAVQEVAQAETGARHPTGHVGNVLLWVAVAWSLFQLWYASPLPFLLNAFVLNDTEARAIHLAFALFLAFTAFPALRSSPRDRIPIQDWAMALVGAFCAAYLFIFYDALSNRPGNPTTLDLVIAVAGMVLLLEATRRALGPPLMIVALVFLAYVFFGSAMPSIIAWAGASVSKAMSHMWLSTEGVFGVALGVSTSFVFLFVLFSALLEKAGAGNYFTQLAFALLGHLRGGPAKASVVSSGLNGVVSGSSIANVVTGGVFTISLMKRVGYTSVQAGAIETSSSVNGQLMPPVMGAAAFLMVEYIGIPYSEVIKHAALPAVISYIALYYIVHLEALKLGLKPIPRAGPARTWLRRLWGALVGFVVTAAACALIYYGVEGLKRLFDGAGAWGFSLLLILVYVGLVAFASRYPDLPEEDPDEPIEALPAPGPTFKAGVHFLLPVVVLIWCLIVELLSPGLSAFYATALMIVIVVTQRPLFAFFRGQRQLAAPLATGVLDLRDGLAAGARNMVGIAVATAAAGIIVGTVTLTGIGLKMTEFVEFISAGSLILMLIFTAMISLVLGMGLPTTANYIVVATLMAPVVVELAAQGGLILPLIAVHMFVFYFGIMADVTPPVGLASFAAAAISGADPIRTGLVASFYSLRTAILPFLFIFNTQLLLIGIDSWWELVLQVIVATIAMLVFAAATMNWFLIRSRLWESAALLLIAFTLFRPGFWWDMIYPPLTEAPPGRIAEAAAAVPAGESLRIAVEGIDIEGRDIAKTVMLPMGPAGPGEERLANAGLQLSQEEGRVVIDMIGFGSAAERAGLDFGFEITGVLSPNERPPQELVWIPALVLLGLIMWLQHRRREGGAGTAPAAAPVTAGQD
jgi:TRAP transporter 4TM/12TM fusion protein